MEGQITEVLEQKIVDSLAAELPVLTRRSVHLPRIARKALAVIGMRRAGKTSLLWQCLSDRLAAGTPREALLYLNFEDERLLGMQASQLQYLTEAYFRLHPQLRDKRRVTFFLDEIQLVEGWESYVRRLMDTESIDVFLSGSSARLLSRELASSMRGRALEVVVHPFSFREVLRHAGEEPAKPYRALSKAGRSLLEHRLRSYLIAGGFPEAQGAGERDRASLLRSYVDVALLRDVIERHAVSNPIALRWMVRQLLSAAASPFSAQKFHDTIRSQGIPVSKDTVHAYLAHLEDSFLVRTVSIHTASERQRMVNPRKAYPIDPGLIPLFERTGRANLGHALETVVMLELDRRGADLGYVRTVDGHEVDFHARLPDGATYLIQVCLDAADSSTLAREIRALSAASACHPDAIPLLLTMGDLPPAEQLPAPLRWRSIIEWLLDEKSGD